MAWFVVRDAFGEVLELAPCADSPYERAQRLAQAVRACQERGDRVCKLDELKYQLTSFDGSVRVLSVEEYRPSFRRDSHLRAVRPSGGALSVAASDEINDALPPPLSRSPRE
jgi:hypothetical protein